MSQRSKEILEKIALDWEKSGDCDRYPSRFLFVTIDDQAIQDLSPIITQQALRLVRISDYFDDKWVTWSTLKKKLFSELNNDRSRSFLIIGMSEYLRFISEKRLVSIFDEILEYDTKSAKRRIYFVMHSMQKLFQGFYQSFHRKDTIDPIITTSSEEEPLLRAIYFSKLSLPQQDFAPITKISLFLDVAVFVQENRGKKVLVNNSVLTSLFSQEHLEDLSLRFVNIESYEELLRDSFPCVTEFYFAHSDDFFLELYTQFCQNRQVNFYAFVTNLFEFRTNNFEEVFLEYLSSGILKNEFRKEVLTEYLVLSSSINGAYDFISTILKKKNKKYLLPDEILRAVILFPFETDENINKFINIRKGVLCSIQRNHFSLSLDIQSAFQRLLNNYINGFLGYEIDIFSKEPEEEKEKIININDGIIKTISNGLTNILTSCFDFERQSIICLFSLNMLSLEDIRPIYENLYFYFHKYPLSPENELDKYFSAYRDSKLHNHPSEELNAFLDQYSETKFFDLYYGNYLSALEGSKALVIDGLSGEYLNFLANMMYYKYNKRFKLLGYRKSILPSITSVNKESLSKILGKMDWVSDLDEKVIHGESYIYYRNLEKALSIIERIVNEKVINSPVGPKIITSDHGSSILHKVYKTAKKYTCFYNEEHDGRCCELLENEDRNSFPASKDYFVFETDSNQNWVLALNGQSLKNTSSREVHGGASLEEVFVPFIEIMEEDNLPNYDLSILKNSVNGLDKSVSFMISPQPSIVRIIDEDNREIECSESDGLVIATLNKGVKQVIKIYVDQTELSVNIGCSSLDNNDEEWFQ